VPASYLLWCWCTAELHVLNDEYARLWHLAMHIIWWDKWHQCVHDTDRLVVFCGMQCRTLLTTCSTNVSRHWNKIIRYVLSMPFRSVMS